MGFFRNPEIKKTILLFALAAVIMTAFGLTVSIFTALYTGIVSIIFTVIFIMITRWRYSRIALMAGKIDRILHAGEELSFSEYNEGELAILQSEVHKMTVRLREQADILKKDKVYLTDSIADISHQLRTPLTSINLVISMLQKTDVTEEHRRDLLKELVMLMSRIDRLVETLLKISKIDAGTAVFSKHKISLNLLIKNAIEPFAVPMELRQQNLRLNVEDGACFTGDFAWTAEAVANVVKNCMEHTPEFGEISITAAENAIYSEILIADNGRGIDKADLPHLFERFYKGKNSSSQSFGIGLALSRMIITSQNGIIQAENRKMERGALFTIRFYKGVV